MVKPKKEPELRSPISYFGAKQKLSKRIIQLFPKHQVFVDVFCGSGAILLAKRASPVEVINDINGHITTLFRVIANPTKARALVERLNATPYSLDEFNLAKNNMNEDGINDIELARRVMVVHRQSRDGTGRDWSYATSNSVGGASESVSKFRRGVSRIPAMTERLKRVQIENRSWEKILDLYDSENTLFYLDPPYLKELRSASGGYAHEMSIDEHKKLVQRLLSIKGHCILSGYAHPTYDKTLLGEGWKRVDFKVVAHTSHNRSSRTECVWISPGAVRQVNKGAVTFTHPNETGRQASARRTHKIRTDETERLLKDAISSLKKTGQNVTQTAVAAISGVSRPQISRRYRHLF